MDPAHDALLRSLERRYLAEGQLVLPAVPALLDHYVRMIAAHFANLGREMSAEQRASLRGLLAQKLRESFDSGAQSNVFIRYKCERMAGAPISYEIASAKSSIAQEYDYWVSNRVGSLFGKHPDAKLMALAPTVGPPGEVPALDVGAGTGRNALPLARAGHRTVAIELSPSLAEVLEDEITKESLDVRVVCGNVLDEGLDVPGGPFRLAVVAEVISHLRSVDELRALFTRLAPHVAPGGVLLASTFLTKPGYDPDEAARQIAEVLWSTFFTRADLAVAMAGLPWELVSDESVLEYERAHLPAHAWPPTTWYESWASGSDAFAVPVGEAPVDLRWLVLRRTGE